MISSDLVLLILVAAGAFYAGFQVGRYKTLSERAPSSSRDASNDAADEGAGPALDGPIVHSAPPRSRAAPPASAGNEGGTWASAGGAQPPRRSTKPPPAAAGLMDKGPGKSR